MSTPNDKQWSETDEAIQARLKASARHMRRVRRAPTAAQPSPAAVDLALAQEKANQEKIGATVQAARAGATQPPAQGILADVRKLLAYAKELEQERDDLQAHCDQVERVAQENGFRCADLQAQRDELLALAYSVVNLEASDDNPFEIALVAAARAAIARATPKQGLGGSDAESISTEGGSHD